MWSSSNSSTNNPAHDPKNPPQRLDATNWRSYIQPQVILPTLVLTGATLGSVSIYRRYLRRISTVASIPPETFRKGSLFGKVTSVGDGDGFRLYHTPGGRLGGWGWLRSVPKKREELVNQTISVRIAGVDAPELAHFGNPAQPYGKEALEWLTEYILNRRVRTYIHRADQYGRVVATAYVYTWGGLWRKNVGLEMLKRGLATVYEAKFGSEFGGLEARYREAEAKAKNAKVGIWSGPGFFQRILGAKAEEKESPREFKTRMAALEKGGVKVVGDPPAVRSKATPASPSRGAISLPSRKATLKKDSLGKPKTKS